MSVADLGIISDAAFTAKLCLTEVMEQVDELDEVVVAMKRKDGTFESVFSHMPVSSAALMTKMLERRLLGFVEDMAMGANS